MDKDKQCESSPQDGSKESSTSSDGQSLSGSKSLGSTETADSRAFKFPSKSQSPSLSVMIPSGETATNQQQQQQQPQASQPSSPASNGPPSFSSSSSSAQTDPFTIDTDDDARYLIQSDSEDSDDPSSERSKGVPKPNTISRNKSQGSTQSILTGKNTLDTAAPAQSKPIVTRPNSAERTHVPIMEEPHTSDTMSSNSFIDNFSFSAGFFDDTNPNNSTKPSGTSSQGTTATANYPLTINGKYSGETAPVESPNENPSPTGQDDNQPSYHQQSLSVESDKTAIYSYSEEEEEKKEKGKLTRSVKKMAADLETKCDKKKADEKIKNQIKEKNREKNEEAPKKTSPGFDIDISKIHTVAQTVAKMEASMQKYNRQGASRVLTVGHGVKSAPGKQPVRVSPARPGRAVFAGKGLTSPSKYGSPGATKRHPPSKPTSGKSAKSAKEPLCSNCGTHLATSPAVIISKVYGGSGGSSSAQKKATPLTVKKRKSPTRSPRLVNNPIGESLGSRIYARPKQLALVPDSILQFVLVKALESSTVTEQPPKDGASVSKVENSKQ